ncbi:hypothetical protein [uncultured Methylobacterium sp.]|uniref:hypothetical protein n=1 Tax=uncultured Methylobacterium sp. TaxID=157278 RepID=UPI0025921A18|nr:hypothetical protein [uncultured Methylobacterium sp.]
MIDEWDAIHVGILRLRAKAGDARESADDVAEWEAEVRKVLDRILRDACHPEQERLRWAMVTELTVSYPEGGR